MVWSYRKQGGFHIVSDGMRDRFHLKSEREAAARVRNMNMVGPANIVSPASLFKKMPGYAEDDARLAEHYGIELTQASHV